ncbi:MAG: response regulator transcription factor [Candidatus Aminicenantales bacterium]
MPEKKILIVDFDVNSLHSLTDLFKSHGMEVVTATDGISAYEKFKEEKPDAVILEAMLPKLHGFDLTLKIFQETKGQIPVIILTGVYKGPQYKSEALRSFGASDYYEKPVDEKKLMDAVMGLLTEEEDIKEELPSPESVLKNLAEMVPGRIRGSQRKPSASKNR